MTTQLVRRKSKSNQSDKFGQNSPLVASGSTIGLASVAVVRTSCGWAGLRGQNGLVTRTTMGQHSEAEARQALGTEGVSPEPDAWLSEAADLLRRFLDGEAVDINRIPLDTVSGTPFQQKVRKAVRAIPPGETRTYGEIAKKVGSPGAARAVGRVMATNQVPLLVPCHRVVGSCGKLIGFSAPSGIVLKQHLLEIEKRAGGQPTVY